MQLCYTGFQGRAMLREFPRYCFAENMQLSPLLTQKPCTYVRFFLWVTLLLSHIWLKTIVMTFAVGTASPRETLQKCVSVFGHSFKIGQMDINILRWGLTVGGKEGEGREENRKHWGKWESSSTCHPTARFSWIRWEDGVYEKSQGRLKKLALSRVLGDSTLCVWGQTRLRKMQFKIQNQWFI